MKLNNLKTTAVAAIACAFVAIPAFSSAQAGIYGHQRDRYNQDRYYDNDIRDTVNRTERESNSFRDYFEHNFRSNGHQQRWDRADRYGHPEHEGRNGQMTLRDAIQNLDEDMERLRSEVGHHGRSRAARDLVDEVRQHASDVDQRISRVSDFYYFNNDRDWRYDRSDLYSRWQELRSDINQMSRDFGYRSRY